MLSVKYCSLMPQSQKLRPLSKLFYLKVNIVIKMVTKVIENFLLMVYNRIKLTEFSWRNSVLYTEYLCEVAGALVTNLISNIGNR